eukprot:gene17896-biopygen11122
MFVNGVCMDNLEMRCIRAHGRAPRPALVSKSRELSGVACLPCQQCTALRMLCCPQGRPLCAAAGHIDETPPPPAPACGGAPARSRSGKSAAAGAVRAESPMKGRSHPAVMLF